MGSEKSKDQTLERGGSGFSTRRRGTGMGGFLMPWPCAGSGEFTREGTWAAAGHSFALVLKGSAPVVLLESSEQTEQAGGQLDSIRPIVVASSS